MKNSNVEIDETKLTEEPSLVQRLKNTIFAIVLGAVLVQMYFFYGSTKSGSFIPTSIFIYFDNFLFIGYLILCGIFGWFVGENFIDWLKVKIDSWKFW